MNVYCVYPAISKIPKTAANCKDKDECLIITRFRISHYYHGIEIM
jgi:hypothetical protein